MSGLVLSLSAGESFIVNGAVLENGDKSARIRIRDGNARVLRCSDAMLPDQVDTPVKQVYYAVQLLITGDLEERDVLPAIFRECDQLDEIFSGIDPSLINVLRSMMNRGNYYSALNHLRKLMDVEAQLLGASAREQINIPDTCVA